ncbi:uncharacterized protein LOC134269764 [Saccostrea cucullata]|uniref:uncharacterized protein LOC134269764 n=1 Tax=Saccostrea cuccullata TaxID=36930 RepID=UPI002ED0AA53
MLKVIAFENFVHFKEKQVINFETTTRTDDKKNKKVVLQKTDDKKKASEEILDDEEQSHGSDKKSKLACFVGANFCGKSTVLELIRRCMTKEINVSVTRSFNENKKAYVFCKFDLQSEEVISGVIKEENKCGQCKFYKILIYSNERGKILRCNTFESSESAPHESFQILTEPEDRDDMKYLFQKHKKESKYVQHILETIQSKENIIEKREGELDWKDLENTYVATMPLRGIGIVQWTKSCKIGDKARNYKMACERAEIISELVSSESIGADKEKVIFDYLTYPQKFTFILGDKEDKDRIWVQHGRFEPFPLLKTSEGIIEAKQVSLLLSHRDIKTLILEEPCRGMHAQMIERLKTVLCQEGLEKTIIVSTHSPYFIDTSTINNTHVFFRTDSKDSNYECNIRNVGLQRELSKVSDVDTLRNLLFATKVLLVEGPSDRDVVQALFTHLRENQQIEIGKEEKPDITTYQIIPIGGCQNVKSVLKFCEFINLPCSCLLDRDKFVSTFPEGLKILDNEYVWKDESDFLREGFQELSEHLRKKHIFIWKYGALEESLLSTDNKNEHIARSLNVDLSDPSNRCKKLKRKLKERLDEEERRCFAQHISEVEEIKRFCKFLKDEDKTRIEKSGILSQEHT